MADINVDVIKIDTSQASNSMKSLKQEMKEVREQMVEMRLRGEETSEAYKQLSERAGELSKAMKLASNDINEASTTFSNTVSYVSGSLAGVTGAVQAATGALSLMGVEMGSDSKLMKILVSAMSMTSGFQAIQNGVESFKKLTTNIKRSTLAQQGFNAALKANPIGAVITAITALIAVMGTFILKAQEAELAAIRAKKAMSDMNAQRYEDQKKFGEQMVQVAIEQAQQEMRILKAKGKSELEVQNQYYKSLEKGLKDYQNRRNELYQKWVAAGGENYELSDKLPADLQAMRDQLDQYTGVINAFISESDRVEQELTVLRTQAATDAAKKKKQEADAVKAENERILASEQDMLAKILESLKTEEQQELDALESKYKTELALMEKYGQDTTALTAKYLADQQEVRDKYAEEARQKQAEAEAKKKEEAQNKVDDLELDQLMEYYRQRLEIVTSGENDIDQKIQELDLAFMDRRKELLTAEHENGLLSDKEYEEQLLELETEMAEKRIKIKQDEVEKKKAIEKGYLQSIQTITSSIGGILGSLGDMMEDETEEQKNLKAAQAIINTIAGAVAAFMGITESTGGWGIAAAIAQAVAVTAAGMAQVAQIYAVDTKGGKNSTSNTGISAGSVSTLSQNYSNTRLVANGGGVYDLSGLEERQENTRVYVLTSDIQSGLNRVNVTTTRNTF